MAHSKTRPSSNDEGSIQYSLKRVMIGSAVGAIAFFALLALTAMFLLKSGIHQSTLPFMAIGIAGIASFISGYTAVRPLRKKGIAYGAFSTIPLAVVIIAAILIANKIGIGMNTLIMLPVMLILGAVGGITAANMRLRHKH